jgi:hypothetical protein
MVLARMLIVCFLGWLLSVGVLGRVLVRFVWIVTLVALALFAALFLPRIIVMVVGGHDCDACDLRKAILRVSR